MKEKLKNMFESDLSRLILTLSLVIPICLGISSMGCSLGLSVKVDPKYLCDWTRDEQMIKMPGFDRSFIIVPSCDYFEAAKVSIATKLFYSEWTKQFGDPGGEIARTLEKLVVEISDAIRYVPGYTTDGRHATNLRANGITFTKSLVWIYKSNEDEYICQTSLIHELVHVAIWSQKSTDGDPDHLGGKYHGWSVDHSAFIQNLNEELCNLRI